MKKLLVILLCLVTSIGYAQDSLIFIPKRVGIWYLERNRTATFLEHDLKIMDSVVATYKVILAEKDIQLKSYGTDSIVWMNLRKAANTRADVYKKGEEFYKGKWKALRGQRNWIVGIAVAIITLLSI